MNSKDAISKLEYIDNPSLFRSVSMALWLYLDKENSLKYSVRTSAKHHGAKQVETERLLRSVVPYSYIDGNRKKNMPDKEKENSRARALINNSFKKYY